MANDSHNKLYKKSNTQHGTTPSDVQQLLRYMLQYWREKEVRDSLAARASDLIALGALYLEGAETGEIPLLVSPIEKHYKC